MSLIEKIKSITCANCRFDCEDNSECNVLKELSEAFNESEKILIKRSVFTLGSYQLDIRYVLDELGGLYDR